MKPGSTWLASKPPPVGQKSSQWPHLENHHIRTINDQNWHIKNFKEWGVIFTVVAAVKMDEISFENRCIRKFQGVFFRKSDCLVSLANLGRFMENRWNRSCVWTKSGQTYQKEQIYPKIDPRFRLSMPTYPCHYFLFDNMDVYWIFLLKAFLVLIFSCLSLFYEGTTAKFM